MRSKLPIIYGLIVMLASVGRAGVGGGSRRVQGRSFLDGRRLYGCHLARHLESARAAQLGTGESLCADIAGTGGCRSAQDSPRELRLLRVEDHYPDRRHGAQRSRPRRPSERAAQEARRPCADRIQARTAVPLARYPYRRGVAAVGSASVHAQDRQPGGRRQRARGRGAAACGARGAGLRLRQSRSAHRLRGQDAAACST